MRDVEKANCLCLQYVKMSSDFLFLFLFPEVIGKYRNKIQGLDKDLKEILKQESEEKEVNKHSCMQPSGHSGMQ